MTSRRLILLFVRLPEPGRVKTRIAVNMGDHAATDIYRWLVRQTLRNLPSDQSAALRVVFDPAAAGDAVRTWITEELHTCALDPDTPVPPSLPVPDFQPQRTGDLGQRLEQAFEEAFADGFESVAVIGSDCPNISAEIFQQVWAALENPESPADAVFGPTEDGGYYLLGLRNRAAAAPLLQGIPWSGPETLAVSLSRAERHQLRAIQLPTVLRDVDTAADWMSCVVAAKKNLRRVMRRRLLENPLPRRAEASRQIFARLVSHPAWIAARVIALYAPLPGEPNSDLCWTLFSESLRGKTLCYPRAQGDAMEFYRTESLADLIEGDPRSSFAGSLRQPPAYPGRLISETEIDLIVLPALAFSPELARLGRAAGHYDRYLVRPGFRARKIGVAHLFQLHRSFPRLKHDQCVDEVIAA